MSSKPRILVVDDDRSISRLLDSILEMEGYPHRIVNSGTSAKAAITEEKFDILISDIYLGDASGIEILALMKEAQPDAEVIIMTAHGSVETAVDAVRRGAFDYVSKPVLVDEMLGVIHRIVDKGKLIESTSMGAELANELPQTRIIGTSAPMVEIYKKLAKVAQIDAPVLVLGESGSGKELVAQSIHANSKRSASQFLVINCGALPETLLESELFGHEKGSFTGAGNTRKGLFESAAGGTVFLDEISETSLSFQVKLLRVIQEREIRRVGSNETIRVDIRLVAATNRDLKGMVRANLFREDLYHRLNVFTIVLPALRDRQADIPLLASYFLKELTQKDGRSIRLSADAIEQMKRYSWPGNVRELRNVIERAFTFNDTGTIQLSDLEFGEAGDDDAALPASGGGGAPSGATSGATPGAISGSSLDSMEREHIIRVLRETGGNKKKAAEVLGIERRTLYSKAKRLGIDF